MQGVTGKNRKTTPLGGVESMKVNVNCRFILQPFKTNELNTMSYRQIFYHIIFGTKHRKMTITEENCEQLYKYIWGIVKNNKCKLYRINGAEDHIHIFSDLHPSASLADYIKDIKIASNGWMKSSGLFPKFEGWQDSYGAFTYSIKEKDNIIHYVKNQKEHHKKETFYDEFRRLLIENGVEFNEKYLL